MVLYIKGCFWFAGVPALEVSKCVSRGRSWALESEVGSNSGSATYELSDFRNIWKHSEPLVFQLENGNNLPT